MTDYVAQLAHQHAVFRNESLRLIADFDTRASIDDNGIVTWNSNSRVPPKDILALWKHVGKTFDYDASVAEYDRQTEVAIADYKRAMAQRTPEEVAEQHAEARAALGPGHQMVNVITGERFTT